MKVYTGMNNNRNICEAFCAMHKLLNRCTKLQ